MLKGTLFLAVAALCVSLPAARAGTQDNAKVALHVASWCDKALPSTCCNFFGPLSESPRKACADFSTEWSGVAFFYRPWLIVAQADAQFGISEISYGLEWDPSGTGVAFFGESACFGTSTSQISGAQAGFRFVWDDCQTDVVANDGVHAIAGSFYIYAYGAGQLAVTPNYLDGETALVVWDCNGDRSEVTAPGGVVGFQMPGFNPCVDKGVPALGSTWSKIKANTGNN